MPTATYEPIATYTVSTPLSAVVFGSPTPISSAYEDLVLVIHGALTGSGVKYIYFNGATTNQSSESLYSTIGGTTGCGAPYGTCYIDVLGSSTNTFQNVVNIFQYKNTNVSKSYLARGNAAAVGTEVIAGVWNSTAAITSIGIATSGNNFETGTVFSLYGIAGA